MTLAMLQLDCALSLKQYAMTRMGALMTLATSKLAVSLRSLTFLPDAMISLYAPKISAVMQLVA
jgi:hypothetical protein